MGEKAATTYTVPIIDLSRPEREVGQALWDAATTVGFFTVINHGIPQQQIDDAFACSEGFFAQSLEEKEAQSPFKRELNSGFEHMKQVRPSTGVPDVKESMQITARGAAMARGEKQRRGKNGLLSSARWMGDVLFFSFMCRGLFMCFGA